MRVSIIKTNGGPHSAETLAAVTSGQIIEVASQGEQELEGRRLELKIIDVLEKYHSEVQGKERANLQSKGSDGLSHNFSAKEHVNINEVVQEIIDAGKSSSWADHFSKPAVIQGIKEIVSRDFETSIMTERFWHCDRNPKDEKAVAFKQVYHG